MHLLAAFLVMSLIVSSDDAIPGSAGNERPECTVVGTPRDDDELRGTIEPDVICGFGGDDLIFARQGADIVFGGRGHDAVLGRSGKDRLYGGRGVDFLIGRGGLDLHVGQRGRDCLAAAEDMTRDSGDVLRGGAGRDHYSIDPGDIVRSAEVANLRWCVRQGPHGG
jgi:Ca2+-binding RTX toxin-like protein